MDQLKVEELEVAVSPAGVHDAAAGAPCLAIVAVVAIVQTTHAKPR